MVPFFYARNKVWFLQPWTVEREDAQHLVPKKHVPDENGYNEVMRESKPVQLEGNNVEGESANIDMDMNVVSVSLDDGEEVVRLVEEELQGCNLTYARFN